MSAKRRNRGKSSNTRVRIILEVFTLLISLGMLIVAGLNWMSSDDNIRLGKSIPDAPTPTPISSDLAFYENTLADDSYNPSALPCVYAFQDLGGPPQNKPLLWYYTHLQWSVHPNENDILWPNAPEPVIARKVYNFPSFKLQNHNPFTVYIDSIKVRVNYTPSTPQNLPNLELKQLDESSCFPSSGSKPIRYMRLPDKPPLWPVSLDPVTLDEDYPIILSPSTSATGNFIVFSITFNPDSYYGDNDFYFWISWYDDYGRDVDDREFGGYSIKRWRTTIDELNTLPDKVEK
jgi:hypothetical protein